jgi:outer membrane protein TolC
MTMNWTKVAALAAVALFPSVARAQEATAPARALSFSEVVKQAIARNPSAQTALAEQRRLEAVVLQTRASSLPTLTFNATYTLLDANRTLPPPSTTIISPQNQIFGNLIVAAPLVAPSSWANWSHAAENVDVQKLSVADQNRIVALSAARGYLNVFALKRLVEVSMIARDNAKAHFDFAKSRLAGGVGTTLDEARAEQEFDTAEVQVQAATIALDRARESLGVIVGENGAIDVKEEPALESPGSLNQALRDAEGTRTDVRLARGQVTAAVHVERDSWTDYMPFVGVIFEPFYQNPPTLTFPTTGWQAQAVLTLPLYDGGYRYGSRRVRTALVDEARIDLDGTLRQVSSDVRVAFSEVRTADDALKAARLASDAATRALSLANTAYHAGAITNLDVIDAERRARDAATQVTIAEDTARQARLDLLAASGHFP